MTQGIQVAVIGAGAMGFQHCRSLAQRIPGAELATVADIDGGAAQRAAALSPGAASTTDYEEILTDRSIQAVIIASPNDTHAQLVREAAEAGKDIFCEKPLGLNLVSADAALAAVERLGVKLQVGFQRRFDPAYRRARRMIEEGELGRIELVVGTTRDPAPPAPGYLRRSGSFFADTAIHDYDSLRFLTGLEVVEVFATASTLHLPKGGKDDLLDTAITSLRLETGALAVITNSRRATYGYEAAMEVLGSSGKVAVGQEQRTMLRRYTSRGVSHDYVDSSWNRFEQAYVEELAHFVQCVALDQQPEVSGQDGRNALEIALLAERATREGRPLTVGDPH